jgi:hypothetical protein
MLFAQLSGGWGVDMIILASVRTDLREHVVPGDEVHLTIEDDKSGSKVILREKITVTKVITYMSIFRFADEDGTCNGFHVCGIFAAEDEVPIELRGAKMYDDLTEEQQRNFLATSGMELSYKPKGWKGQW